MEEENRLDLCKRKRKKTGNEGEPFPVSGEDEGEALQVELEADRQDRRA